MLLMRSCDLIPKDPLELKRLLSRFPLSVHALAPCQVNGLSQLKPACLRSLSWRQGAQDLVCATGCNDILLQSSGEPVCWHSQLRVSACWMLHRLMLRHGRSTRDGSRCGGHHFPSLCMSCTQAATDQNLLCFGIEARDVRKSKRQSWLLICRPTVFQPS